MVKDGKLHYWKEPLNPKVLDGFFFFPFFGRNQQPDSEVLKLTWKREPPRWPRQSCRRTKLDGLQPDINLLPIHRQINSSEKESGIQKETLHRWSPDLQQNAIYWSGQRMVFSINDAGSILSIYPHEKNKLHSTSQHTQKLPPDRLKFKMRKTKSYKSFLDDIVEQPHNSSISKDFLIRAEKPLITKEKADNRLLYN